MLRKIIFCLLTGVIPCLGNADEVRFYTVEVVVFENLDPQVRQSENWPTESKTTLPSPLVELGTPTEQKYGFRTLPKSNYRLLQEIKSLENSNQYRILLHTAWRQPGLETQSALPVHLVAEVKPVTQVETTTANTTAADSSAKILDGTVKIVLGRFLHAEVDLTYQDNLLPSVPNSIPVPANSKAIEVKGTPIYRLKQARKMRSKEIHYLDSPVLGILVLITPLEG